MADKGFKIQDLLAIKSTFLIALPPPQSCQVTIFHHMHHQQAEGWQTQLRVHVERIIRKIECFSVLRGVIPLTLKSYITSIVRVCAAIVNLQPSIIKVE